MNKSKYKTILLDFLLGFFGTCFVFLAITLFNYTAEFLTFDGRVIQDILNGVMVLAFLMAGYNILIRRFMWAAIGGLCVLFLLGYDVIYPYVDLGFIPSGYFNNLRISEDIFLGILLVIFIVFCFFTYKKKRAEIKEVDLKKVLVWGGAALVSIFTIDFTSNFVRYVGGTAIEGRLVDSKTMVPIENAKVVIMYGAGVNKKSEGKFSYGQSSTDINGHYFIKNERRILTRLQTNGFQEGIYISAPGYDDIALMTGLPTYTPGAISRINLKMIKSEK